MEIAVREMQPILLQSEERTLICQCVCVCVWACALMRVNVGLYLHSFGYLASETLLKYREEKASLVNAYGTFRLIMYLNQ
jgi:hypothetical protein